nr:MAG TPA: hypothetical protein [Caudoviricetes sp.]
MWKVQFFLSRLVIGSKYCNKLGMKLTRRRTPKALVKIALCSLQ